MIKTTTQKILKNNYARALIASLVALGLLALDSHQYSRYNEAVSLLNQVRDNNLNTLYKELRTVTPLSHNEQAQKAIEIIRSKPGERIVYAWYAPYIYSPIYKDYTASPVSNNKTNKNSNINDNSNNNAKDSKDVKNKNVYTESTIQASNSFGPEALSLYKNNNASFMKFYESVKKVKHDYPSISVFIFASRLETKLLKEETDTDSKTKVILSHFTTSGKPQWIDFYKASSAYQTTKKGELPLPPIITSID